MPCFFCPTKKSRLFPFESFFKFTFLSIHSVVEYMMNRYIIFKYLFHQNIVRNFYCIKKSNGHKLPREIVHHICMISGFIVGALVEILIYFGLPFPKKTE